MKPHYKYSWASKEWQRVYIYFNGVGVPAAHYNKQKKTLDFETPRTPLPNVEFRQL